MGLSGKGVLAQGAANGERTPEAFASENAILDTAIPFAIGAREARQVLRGSFGWPSFQEGLVEGVYFRFDPDGYARFAPTPRLDVDVFEVICRPRTYACAARKEGLEVFLTDRGQLQVKLENALSGDLFFVSEGVSEIQVPERILQPLDVPLELLLGSGGELSARRGNSEVVRVSLKGFSAVTAYLRWIAANQDYSVLPRGWPVPNADRISSGTMTQPAAWNSPMPQPQVIAPGYAEALVAGIAPATSTAPVTVQQLPVQHPQGQQAPIQPFAPHQPAQPGLGVGGSHSENASAEALRTDIETLKHLILQIQTGNARTAGESVMSAPRGPAIQEDTEAMSDLVAVVGGIQTQLERLKADAAWVGEPEVSASRGILPIPAVTPNTLPQLQVEAAPSPTSYGQASPAQMAGMSDSASEVKKLDYLINTIGLDPQTALSILAVAIQKDNKTTPATPELDPSVPAETQRGTGSTNAQPMLYQNGLVDQILSELEAELAQGADTVRAGDISSAAQNVSVEDYVILSRYFRSAALPVLQHFAATQ
ncbi:hypothetical protein [Shimia sp.]|uniref:hypothetical protein n=1 Tax=Shimia sp. TaxID=1954381 RepID=UPI003B8D2391